MHPPTGHPLAYVSFFALRIIVTTDLFMTFDQKSNPRCKDMDIKEKQNKLYLISSVLYIMQWLKSIIGAASKLQTSETYYFYVFCLLFKRSYRSSVFVDAYGDVRPTVFVYPCNGYHQLWDHFWILYACQR